MKRLLILAVTASGVLTSACASRPSIEPGAIQRPVPLECVLPCPEPAPLVLHRQAWEAETASRFLQCRVLHDDCARGLADAP